jgi:hypothetical protein
MESNAMNVDPQEFLPAFGEALYWAESGGDRRFRSPGAMRKSNTSTTRPTPADPCRLTGGQEVAGSNPVSPTQVRGDIRTDTDNKISCVRPFGTNQTGTLNTTGTTDIAFS